MNIDRDDEYATRYEAAPTMPIVRQIELITERRDNALLIAERKRGDDREGWLDDAFGYNQVLASLEKLDTIESQPVPVEPTVAMISAGLVAASDSGEITQVYKAMIKAAQEAK